MSAEEKLAAIVALVDGWMEKAGPDSEAHRVFGPQVVGVTFVHDEIHEIADAAVSVGNGAPQQERP